MALFDYDPVSMSPNPDAGEEELPFREGQILKVTNSPSGPRALVSLASISSSPNSSCVELGEGQRT